MTWLFFADQTDSQITNHGADVLDGGAAGRDTPLPRGSLTLETHLSSHDRPETFLGMRRIQPEVFSLAVHAVPGGGVALVLSRGTDVFHTALNCAEVGRADVLRITYCWDLASGLARVSLERPELGKSYQTVLPGAIGLTPDDILSLAQGAAAQTMSPDVLYYAVSDRIEPIGPMPGLTASVPVMTPTGFRPVGEIKSGDVITTLEGGDVPVLDVVRRTVPARGLFEPVRLRAPYFDLKKDIVVAPCQRLVVGGSRVEYLFGAEHVLAPARHLINGTAAVRERGHGLVSYVHLLLPDHEAMLAAGTYVESLNIGRLRRDRALLAASMLARRPRHSLPEHSRILCPVLGPFEAITLAEQRAA